MSRIFLLTSSTARFCLHLNCVVCLFIGKDTSEFSPKRDRLDEEGKVGGTKNRSKCIKFGLGVNLDLGLKVENKSDDFYFLLFIVC